MVIKKVLKFIDKIKKNQLRSKQSVIVGVRSGSTAIGRQKILSLKKIGKEKREGVKISRVKNIN
jgi:hypothetical protein